jgi:processive 1,2-diacylglycerol beta-glucosyltransferase
MFDKVLILSASAGAGHIRAAQAVEAAFRFMNAAREVRHVDTLEYTNAVFRALYSKAYIDMVNRAPTLLGWLYEQTDKPFKNEKLVHAFNKLNTLPFIRMLEEFGPDLIVCTHFLPSEIISRLKEKKKLACPQAVVVTDFDAHGMWLCHCYEHYFVALEETCVYLQALGVPGSKIRVTGIPIDPVFSQPKDKAEMRLKYGLKPDRPTILTSAGGFGVGPSEQIISSLLQLDRPAQVIASCGKNEELRKKLERIAAKASPRSKVDLKIIGFTTDMDEFMTASDILLGKPGGLTTSEALAKGLVFVIVNPIPGQEERNSDHLLEEGAAIRCNNLPALSFKLNRLFDDTARFAAMQANVRRLAHPHAARDIVRHLQESHDKQASSRKEKSE